MVFAIAVKKNPAMATAKVLLVHSRKWSTHDELVRLVRTALRRRLLPRTVTFVPRSVHARALPTDFVSVRIAGVTAVRRARRALAEHPLVRAVDLQRRFHSRGARAGGRGGKQGAPRRWPLSGQRRRGGQQKRLPRDFLTRALNASHWWRRGVKGQRVRVAIFDTGLNREHDFASHVVEIVNFTNEPTNDDRVGHSTFMTGTIASHGECPGLAPEVELTIVRVFDSEQASATSWFLDGFNFALQRKFDLINFAVSSKPPLTHSQLPSPM